MNVLLSDGTFSILITPQPTCSNVSTCNGLNVKPCRELRWLLYRDIFEQTEKLQIENCNGQYYEFKKELLFF